MVYVALLRGINVGGKAKVPMAQLKALFEALGCENVSTYINSGNVIFSDKRTSKELEPLLEAGIEKEFGFPVHVLLRDRKNITKLCKEIPAAWTNDMKQRTDVIFLWDKIDNADILQKIVIKPAIEEARYIDGAMVWTIGRENVTRGGTVKLIGTEIYPLMTIRNINTVRKLETLMSQV